MFEIPINDVLRGLLIFLRVGGILFALPVFGDQPTPVRARLLLSAALAYGLSPVIPQAWGTPLPTELLSLVGCVARELIVGLLLGFLARVAFEGMLMAASTVGYQMGFGTATLFMPDASEQMNGFTAFHRLIVILLFFGLDLHQLFLKGMVESFQIVPAGHATISAPIYRMVVDVTAQIFAIGIQLAAPILVALMFTMAALGLVARTVPQFNVFIMSFPASFIIGILIYIATLPFFPDWMTNHFEHVGEMFAGALRALRP